MHTTPVLDRKKRIDLRPGTSICTLRHPESMSVNATSLRQTTRTSNRVRLVHSLLARTRSLDENPNASVGRGFLLGLSEALSAELFSKMMTKGGAKAPNGAQVPIPCHGKVFTARGVLLKHTSETHRLWWMRRKARADLAALATSRSAPTGPRCSTYSACSSSKCGFSGGVRIVAMKITRRSERAT